MRNFKKVSLALLGLVSLVIVYTGLTARVREQKIVQVIPGMQKRDVDRLLGAGRPDIMSPACDKCPTERAQYVYSGNPSLWYGHFEDALVVCYTNDFVCGITRVGL